ncbi:preprotein translocase subunit YajC [Marinivivus vitaminiproducens]|uniref:preprotein translocase subunit YajC n=1 Tax=Marinivivus vitaminiproducens TaxID=3035935 RepID=UPI0027AAFA95|nr:preprotein translocase subunit YajC [Geminicoccaceae bacterium SCSIO 64248]
MLISPAYAQAAPAGPGAFDLVSLLPLILIFVVFYFLLIRPQQRKMKEHREMLAAVRKGDRVVTGGGLIGTVVKVEDGDDMVIVEIAQNVRVRAVRSTLANKLSVKPAGGSANDDAKQATAAAEAKPSFLSRFRGR